MSAAKAVLQMSAGVHWWQPLCRNLELDYRPHQTGLQSELLFLL